MPQIETVEITEELKQSFINYAMSVIVDRALPDVRDGLKPVQRRILFGAYQEGVLPNRKHVKSAKIVGEVMGKYHPHGDAAIYEALVRLAQPWNLRYPLVDGQGNFGSIDGDPPAAQRYTEARLSPLGAEMLQGLEKETVDFRPNYDGSLKEPEVLPAALPNLLVNGASGIAVGMATSLPPHNLGEVVDALVAMIENPGISLEEVLGYLPGPDFPTGGKLARKGIREAYATGRGSLRLRAKVRVEEKGGRPVLVVTEIPYQVNKANLIAQIAGLVKAKKVEEIAALRDESDRKGLRIVIELKRGANPEAVLNTLYKHTALQTSFTVNLLAIVNGEPKVLSLLEVMRHYLDHRREVLRRQSLFDLREAEERAHILEGLLLALDHLDEVIALIRGSKDAAEAKAGLMGGFGLSEAQAQAILEMRLQRLVALERAKLQEEYQGLQEEIARLRGLLEDEAQLWGEVKRDLLRIKELYADPRRTLITAFEEDFAPEDLVPDEPMVLTLTAQGFLKRQPLEAYRAQGRGGKGSLAGRARAEDETSHVLVAGAHAHLLLFTNQGRVYRLRVHEVPEMGRQARGVHAKALLPLGEEERVAALLAVESLEEDRALVFATERGLVKRTPLAEYANLGSSGLIAIRLQEGDRLVGVALADPEDEVLLATREGMAIRFPLEEVRATGRDTQGVTGIRLKRGEDRVVSLVVVKPGEAADLLAVGAKGYGKRTPLGEYPLQGRGGVGVITYAVGPKVGHLTALLKVRGDEDLLLLSKRGLALRTSVEGIRQSSRATAGVKLMNLPEEDEVASAFVVEEG